MATVRLAFSPAPEYVRTARLVGVAVARRAGVAEELLEDVRLAIGEACGLAVARCRRAGRDDLVQVEMSDDGPYTVRVRDTAGGAAGDDPDESDQMGEVLLAGLVEQLRVHHGEDGTEVQMTWPTRQYRL
jgi:anti-sigma regulatory factor (Ser/Thr protein kinase)